MKFKTVLVERVHIAGMFEGRHDLYALVDGSGAMMNSLIVHCFA